MNNTESNEEISKVQTSIQKDHIEDELDKNVDMKVEMNVFAKMIGIIFAPIKTLYALKSKPTFLIVAAVVCSISFLGILLTWSSYEPMMIAQMEQQFETMNLEITAEMMDFQLVIAKVTMLVVMVFGSLLAGLIGGVYYFVCAKITKSEVGFKPMISLAYHTLVITACLQILNMLLSVMGVSVNLALPITSLASLLPSGAETSILFGVLMPFEVFSLWALVITYFGLRIIASMSKKAALISVSISFIFGLTMTVGSILIGQLFTNI